MKYTYIGGFTATEIARFQKEFSKLGFKLNKMYIISNSQILMDAGLIELDPEWRWRRTESGVALVRPCRWVFKYGGLN